MPVHQSSCHRHGHPPLHGADRGRTPLHGSGMWKRNRLCACVHACVRLPVHLQVCVCVSAMCMRLPVRVRLREGCLYVRIFPPEGSEWPPGPLGYLPPLPPTHPAAPAHSRIQARGAARAVPRFPPGTREAGHVSMCLCVCVCTCVCVFVLMHACFPGLTTGSERFSCSAVPWPSSSSGRGEQRLRWVQQVLVGPSPCRPSQSDCSAVGATDG